MSTLNADDRHRHVTPVTRWETAGRPVGCVHILHGMAEHRGRYARLAQCLAAGGYVVWAHDHRGHGTNVDGPKGHFGERNGWRLVVDDTAAVTRRMVAEYPGVPLFLFGHSMGSFIAQTLMNEQAERYAGVVLAGTCGRARISHCLVLAISIAERAIRGPRQRGQWSNALLRATFNRQFRPARTAFDWLSRDEPEVDTALSDPLCGDGLTTQSWVDYAKGLLILDARAYFRHIRRTLPILILAGTRDPVGNNGRGPVGLARTLQMYGAHAVTLKLYPLARHELVNETNRSEVTRDLINWLNGCTLKP